MAYLGKALWVLCKLGFVFLIYYGAFCLGIATGHWWR